MKMIYVAGPYRSHWKIFKKLNVLFNIIRARKVAKKLWECGYAVICPHSNTAFFDKIPASIILPGDIEMLKKCDLVIVLPEYKESSGTKEELLVAKKMCLPIYYILDINKFIKVPKKKIVFNFKQYYFDESYYSD